MKENIITAQTDTGTNETHYLLESENQFEVSIMTSQEFLKILTKVLHCLDFALSKGKDITDPVTLEIKKITYEEEIDYIHRLVAYLVEKKRENKPKIDITAL